MESVPDSTNLPDLILYILYKRFFICFVVKGRTRKKTVLVFKPFHTLLYEQAFFQCVKYVLLFMYMSIAGIISDP